MPPVGRALVVLLLAVVAGCGGPAGAADVGPVSVTPAPVPADEPATTTAPGTPDPRPGAFSRPAGRAAVHAAVLDGTSHAVAATTTVRFAASGRTVGAAVSGRFDDAARAVVAFERTDSAADRDGPTTIVVYAEGERAVRAAGPVPAATATVVRDADGDPVAPPAAFPVDPRFRATLESTFAATTIDAIARLQRGGQPHERVLLEVSGPPPGSAPPALPVGATLGEPGATVAVDRLAARLVVDERGLVHRLDLEAAGTLDGERVTVERTVRFVGLGATTVRTPAWATEALARPPSTATPAP